MICDCGSPINSYNQIGICNQCIQKNEFVTVRFVISNTILPFWSRVEYENYVTVLNENNKKFKYRVLEFKCRSRRVRDMTDLLRQIDKGEQVESLEVGVAIAKLFLIDIMKTVSDEELAKSDF